MITTIGWIGSICLAFSAMPQAWQCYCQGHARGLSILTLCLWLVGEVCYIVATIGEFGMVPWLLTNYVMNLVFLSVILRYWICPKS
jgi:uncharacterized protein with PQ loop repeat